MFYIPLILSVLFLFACAPLRPGPFHSLESSVTTANKALETEMARDVEWTREADVEALASTPDAPLSHYMLKETKGYAWVMPVTPPHWEARHTLGALKELNAAFQYYLKLLSQVAEGNPKDVEENKSFAAAMNESLRSAEDTFATLNKENYLALAGVSALTAESLTEFKRSSRAQNLKEAVKKNQLWVDQYAGHCQAMIDLIRADLKTAYSDRIDALHERWDDKRTPGRNTLARSIFNLNEEYINAMHTLKGLSLFYNNLPMAHHALSDGLTRKATPTQHIANLAAYADRVARLTKDLEKAR